MQKTEQQWAEELYVQAGRTLAVGCPGGFVDFVSKLLAEVRQAEREECAKIVPTNWLDPLLTGPDQVIGGKAGQWGCPNVESLLRAIQKRIRSREEVGRG